MGERPSTNQVQRETASNNRQSLRERLIARRQQERAKDTQTLPVTILSSPLLFETGEIPEGIEPEITIPPNKEFTIHPTRRTDHTDLVSKVVQSATTFLSKTALSTEEQEIAEGLAVWIMNPSYVYDLAVIKNQEPEALKQKILSNVCNNELRGTGGEIVDFYNYYKDPEKNKRAAQKNLKKVFRDIPKKAQELLTKREYEIFHAANKGIPLIEIANKFGLKNADSVSGILTSARKKIQQNLIIPEGIKKVSSYKDKGVLYAAGRGAVIAVKFLGEYYTTDQLARDYFTHRTNRIDSDLINKGYILLQDLLSPEEYERARKKRTKFTSFITYHQKRLYVSPENREKILSLAAGETVDRKPINADVFPNHRTLRNIARNNVEYSRLKVAVRKGLLPAIKTNYATMVLPEDVETYLAKYYPEVTYESSQKETIVFPEPA